MLFAFLGTLVTNFCAFSEQVSAMLGIAGKQRCGKSADIRTITVKANAVAHHQKMFFA